MATAKNAPSNGTFGTFSGVFVPNVLTILGVILFMRTGWVIGQAGVWNALLILIIANSITLLTSLSLSAIATNKKVEGGGAYFMISRSLGLEIGSSIGVPFYLAQAISVAFYIVGFTESLSPFLPDSNPLYIALGVLSVLFIIAWLSADLALKIQNLILIILSVSIISFFAGWVPDSSFHLNTEPSYSDGFFFWTVFAIFFPAVTGVMAGASMSGDLKDPSKSIPLGTLLAVGVTFLVYTSSIFLLARNGSPEELDSNPMIMRDLSAIPPLIYAGLWAATLSSALASLLGAPRTLQALSRDGVFPRFLAKKSGPKDEPRIALVVSGLIAGGCLLIGKLDLIAPIISMFFLATYSMINWVSFVEGWAGNPSFRPTFRVHWIISLIGAVGCLVVMFLLNVAATLVSMFLMLGLYFFLVSKRYQTAWGDTWSGVWFNITRTSLIKFAKSRQHIRNWRPVILVLSGNPKTRPEMVRFANAFESKRGFLFLSQILVGDWKKLSERRKAAIESMDTFIQKNRLTAEAKVVIADDFEEGVCSLIQSSGVGPLVPNTILLGWSGDQLKSSVYLSTLRKVLELGENVVILKENTSPNERLGNYIDVWWGAKVNGSLMLILAHLLRSNREWRGHELRVLSISKNDEASKDIRKNMIEILKESRISANVVVLSPTEDPVSRITETSANSKVSFVGFNLELMTSESEVFQKQKSFLDSMNGTVMLCKNWEELEL